MIEYPKMVYKNEVKEVIQHKDEVGYLWKIIKSEDEESPEWGALPGADQQPKIQPAIDEAPILESEESSEEESQGFFSKLKK